MIIFLQFECEKTLEISRANRGRLLLYGLDALVELAGKQQCGLLLLLMTMCFIEPARVSGYTVIRRNRFYKRLRGTNSSRAQLATSNCI